jgi:serine protease inhibitor
MNRIKRKTVKQQLPFTLYQQVCGVANQDENLFFSPSSISLLMSAVSLGADNETAAEIWKAFDFADNKTMQNTVKTTRASASGNFIISNSFWHQSDWTVNRHCLF